MLRGIFMAGGVTADQVQYYIDLMKQVRETPEWKDFLEQGAFNQTTLNGKEYESWVAHEEARHMLLMKDAGFLAK
jgi:tripartite-type tricarboxylate transporter receptor subunit TctC